MKATFDNEIYFNWRNIDGYNKDINIAISPREPGKTTSFWITKAYPAWKKEKRPVVYLVRYANEISNELIDSIFDGVINKFKEDEKPIYKQNFKDGILDVFLLDNKEKYLAIRVISLNCKLRKLKQQVVPNIKYMFMDEYIINPKAQEDYLKSEAMKIKELYTTLKRGSPDGRLRFYVAGNPYSLYNPLFLDLGVDTSKLKRGETYSKDNYVIEWATLHPKLREKLLKENPFYQFDENYSNYALDGMAINDISIPVGDLPPNYQLKYLFKIAEKFIGIYKENGNFDINDFRFFAKEEKIISKYRSVYVIDLEEMITNSILISSEERYYMNRLKEAIAKRNVLFESINVYYLMMEVFKAL